MPKSLSQNRKLLLAVALTLLLTAYQLARTIAFVEVYGGVEHDGGWMLSISRSLAERGAYTTMVSTLPDPQTPGAVSVEERFDIQAPDGRIWFFTGNGIGPASIGPDALVLKLFGFDFWALRAGPLLFYTLFLLLAAYVLYRLAGLAAVVLFHVFLFFYPHLTVMFSYEALGETPTMLYVLLAYLAFARVIRSEPYHRRCFYLAGLAAGLAVNTKLIALWSISGVFIWAAVLWVRSKKLRTGHLLALAGGAVTLPLLWELLQLVILIRLANFELYLQHAQQRLAFVLDDGSGARLRLYAGADFFWDKFFLLAEVAHPQRWVTGVIFIAILLAGPALLWLWRDRPYRRTLAATMWLGWLVNTLWFVSLAKTGWPRHFWFGLVLAVMLLCVTAVTLIRLGLSERKGSLGNSPGSRPAGEPGSKSRLQWPALAAGLLLTALIGWGWASQPYVRSVFLPDEIVPYWREKRLNFKYGASLPSMIIPRAAQAEVVNYIKEMPPEANVYYPDGHKTAEIPPQTGRVHYPLQRRNYPGVEPHPADVVIISPALISPWKDPIQRQDLLELVKRECPYPAVENDFYMVCPIEPNLSRTE